MKMARRIRFKFSDGTQVELTAESVTSAQVSQFGAMARSDDPEMSAVGKSCLMEVSSQVVDAQATAAQRTAAGFSSGAERAAERRPEWDKWQAEYDRLRSLNPQQSNSQICAKVADRFGVSRRAVSSRVKVVGRERPRSKT